MQTEKDVRQQSPSPNQRHNMPMRTRNIAMIRTENIAMWLIVFQKHFSIWKTNKRTQLAKKVTITYLYVSTLVVTSKDWGLNSLNSSNLKCHALNAALRPTCIKHLSKDRCVSLHLIPSLDCERVLLTDQWLGLGPGYVMKLWLK
jgi:hypothetical protein